MKIGIEVVLNSYEKGFRRRMGHDVEGLVEQFSKAGVERFKRYIEAKSKHGLVMEIYCHDRIVTLNTCCPYVTGWKNKSVVFSMDEFDDPFVWDKPDAEDILTLILKKLENDK